MSKLFKLSFLLLVVLSASHQLNRVEARSSNTEDWPQFRGQNGDGVSPETGLLKSWPQSGPPEVWRVPIGEAYSGIAVVGERLYTMDSRGDSEFLLCMNARNGQEIWRTEVGPLFQDSNGSGPRSTPTINDGLVYAFSGRGHLLAADANTGREVWSVDTQEKFIFEEPPYWWGFSGAPLVDGDLLLLEVGGEGEKSIAALNKKNGEVVWTTHSDLVAYSTPIAIDFAGKRQYVFVTSKHVVSLSPSGEVHWRMPWEGNIIKIAMPIFVPPDMILVSASYDVGAVLFKMKAEGSAISAERVWESKVMRNHFNSSVLVDDYLYGFDNATLKCIDPKSGTQHWAKRRLGGKGSLIYADGHLVVLGERGQLLLVEANPEKYVEKARVQLLDGRTWTSPSLADGRLYIRNQKEMVCLDLRAGEL